MRAICSLQILINACLFFASCTSQQRQTQISDAGYTGGRGGNSVSPDLGLGSGGTAGSTTAIDAKTRGSDATPLGSGGTMGPSTAVDTGADVGDAPLSSSGDTADSTSGIDVVADAIHAMPPDSDDAVGVTRPLDGGNGNDAASVGWQLVWSDEFSGEQIDPSRWNHEVNCWGGGNNEQECYVADTKNSFVSDGLLHITAIADSPTGMVGGPSNDPTLIGKPYSSARLNTQELGDWKYGRIEVRAQLPSGQGLWPAIWMLPTDSVYGAWAQSGEIDIMEAINLAPGNNIVYGTLHYGDEWPNNVSSGTHYTPEGNAWEAFHVYALEWEEGEIRWFVDDVQYAAQRRWYSNGYPYPAPFDQRFYLVINLSVGGDWPGAVDARTTFPKTMLVDFVRVYQCVSDLERGKGCGKSDPSVVPLQGIASPDAQ
jgi:beta-glucanase (GH16 family)